VVKTNRPSVAAGALAQYAVTNQTNAGSNQTRQTYSWLQHEDTALSQRHCYWVYYLSASLHTPNPPENLTMDPYSPEGGKNTPPTTSAQNPATNNPTELINIHSAFHAGAFQHVLDFDTSSFSSSNALPVRVLKLRSQIALGQAKGVSAELASEKTPDLVAVKLLADYEQGKDVVSQAKKLAEQHGQENLSVQLLVGIVLERAGETEDALALLSKHQGNLDA
jgi:hypothetical protein